jgi:hypothetical protein
VWTADRRRRRMPPHVRLLDLGGPRLPRPYQFPARNQRFQAFARHFQADRPPLQAFPENGSPESRVRLRLRARRFQRRAIDASRARPEASKAPKIASNSFHLWRRIRTYQSLVSDSSAKFFSGPFLRRDAALPIDRSQRAEGVGMASMEADTRLSPQDGVQGTKMEHRRHLVKQLFLGREMLHAFSMQYHGYSG